MLAKKRAAAIFFACTPVVLAGCSGGDPKPVSATAQPPGPGTSAAPRGPTSSSGRIAFRRFSDDTHTSSQIVTSRLDGSAQQDVTPPKPNVSDGFPSWSPDGTRLAFSRHEPRTGCGEDCSSDAVFVVDAAGGPATRLTPDGACVRAPVHTCDSSPAW